MAMTVTLKSNAGIGAEYQIQGTPECHRITITPGTGAINGFIARINFEGMGDFGTDNISVTTQLVSGFLVGELLPQGIDATGYDMNIQYCMPESSDFVFDGKAKEIIEPI